MPSSTFSFERAPAGASGKTLIVALACAGLLLGLTELYLRSSSGRPSVPLSTSRYATNLEEGLANPDVRTTFLLGSSRMRGAFSSQVFEERTGRAPLYYLATSGQSPLALIFYLAEETAFSGKLIVSLSAGWLSGGSADDQQYIVDYFENEWNWNKRLNHVIGDQIASRFVVRQDNYSVANVVKSVVLEKDLPTVPYWVRNAPNGESFYDFSLNRDRSRLQPPLANGTSAATSDPVWETNLSRLKRAMSRFRERGGQLSIIRFPTSRNTWANDQVRWPRARYWNRIADAVGPTAVHFQDIPAMRRFDLPDASHIDVGDRDAFTRVLLDALIARGMTWEP